MKNVTIKGLLAHKLRLALTSLAIVLGVTFIAGTFVLTDTLHDTFSTLFGNIYQKVDFQVRGVAQFSGNSCHCRAQPDPGVGAGHRRARPRGGDGSRASRGIRSVRRPGRQGHFERVGRHPWDCVRPSPPDLRIAAHHGKTTDDLRRRRNGRCARPRNTTSRWANLSASCPPGH